jgi:hypothetical protein
MPIPFDKKLRSNKILPMKLASTQHLFNAARSTINCEQPEIAARGEDNV